MDILQWQNRFEGLRPSRKNLQSRIQKLRESQGLLRAGLRQRASVFFIPRVIRTTWCLRPWCINLIPDFRCSQQCAYCSNAEVYDSISHDRLPLEWKTPMPPSVFTKILDEARGFMPVIGIVGGEPLLYPHFDQLLHAISTRGLHASMTTNGCLLDEKAKVIVSCRLPILGVSIDGPTALIHNSIAGSKDSFERAATGIEQIKKLKRAQKSPYPSIKLILTICSSNQHHITESIRRMIEFDPEIISVRHLISTSPQAIDASPKDLFRRSCGLTVPFGGREALTEYRGFDGKLIAEQLTSCVDLMKRKRIRFSIEPSMSHADTESFYSPDNWRGKSRQCWVPWNLLEVMPNGDTVFCGLHFLHVTGNTLRQTIDEIWYGDPMRKIRRLMLDSSPFPVCSRCCMTFADL